MKAKWKKLPQGNMILEKKDYFISYNPAVGRGEMSEINIFNDCCEMIGSLFGLEGGNPEETAIVTEQDGKKFYRILKGDWRIEYGKCKTLAECLRVYTNNIEHQSSWSTDAPL